MPISNSFFNTSDASLTIEKCQCICQNSFKNYCTTIKIDQAKNQNLITCYFYQYSIYSLGQLKRLPVQGTSIYHRYSSNEVSKNVNIIQIIDKISFGCFNWTTSNDFGNNHMAEAPKLSYQLRKVVIPEDMNEEKMMKISKKNPILRDF